MNIKLLSVCLSLVLVAACAGQKSHKVSSLQKKDKQLSCKEIMLEVNEAEFYRKTAEKNKALDVSSVLMPVGYISTYVNAEEASDAANARVEYLNRIYEILDCDNPKAAAQQIVIQQPARPIIQGSVYSQGYPAAGGGYAQPSNFAPVPAGQAQYVAPSGQPMYHQAPSAYDSEWYW